MKISSPKLYIIAERGVFRCDEEWLGMLQVVAECLTQLEGCALQVRAQGYSTEFRSKQMRLARESLESFMNSGLKALANTSIEEATELEFSGVHLSRQNTPSSPILKKSIPSKFLVGASTHDLESIQKAAYIGADFVLLGPAFEPLSKSKSPIGLELFSNLSRQAPLPVLALGGITPKRVAPCIHAGAFGVAMISSVMKASNPKRVIQNLHQEIEHASHTKRSSRAYI